MAISQHALFSTMQEGGGGSGGSSGSGIGSRSDGG